MIRAKHMALLLIHICTLLLRSKGDLPVTMAQRYPLTNIKRPLNSSTIAATINSHLHPLAFYPCFSHLYPTWPLARVN